MKIKCTVEELKRLIKEEQTECKFECSKPDLKYLQNKVEKETINRFSSNHIEIEKELAEIKEIFLQFLKIEKIKLESRYGPRAKQKGSINQKNPWGEYEKMQSNTQKS